MTVQITPQFAPAERPVEPVRFLDEEGRLLDGAVPELDDEQVLEALRFMMLGRTFDTKSFSQQRQGKLGTFAPVHGQEGALMGSAMALDPARDWIVPQYRELPAMLRHGCPAERILLYRQGHPEGGFVPDGVKVFQQQISLGTHLPHAVGMAWGMKLQRRPGVVVVYFGDGASSEGDFHESCNLAGVVKAPVIFFLQNNQWAISTPRELQSATADLAARAPGYGFPGVSVDGNDLLAVHKVTAAAVRRALAGEGPTLIEAHNFRLGPHTTADDPTRYVDPEQKKRWERRDPIKRVQKYLQGRGKWDEATAATWETEIAAQIDDAFVKAAAYPPAQPDEIYRHVFQEPTATLERQRAWHLGNS